MFSAYDSKLICVAQLDRRRKPPTFPLLQDFKFTKKGDQKQTRVPTTKQEKEQITATDNEPHDTCKKSEEKCSAIVDRISTTHVDKKDILKPLRKHIRNLIETQSQTLKQIELQIKETQKHLLR